MLEAPPSVISSTWRGNWVISVTLSKSMEERVRPAPQRTVMPLSSESYSPAARHSIAQIVSDNLHVATELSTCLEKRLSDLSYSAVLDDVHHHFKQISALTSDLLESGQTSLSLG